MSASIWSPSGASPSGYVKTTELADAVDESLGAGMVGYSSTLTYPALSVGKAITDITDISDNLSDITDNAKGAALVGYNAALTYPANSVGALLNLLDGEDALLRSDLASSSVGKGSKLIAFIQRLTSAVARLTEDKLAERVSVFDFFTSAQIADVQAGTLALNVTVPVQAAIAAAMSSSGTLYFPAGKYRLSTFTLTGIRGLNIEGASAAYLSAGVHFSSNTVFSFDSDTSGNNGLVITDFTGLTVRNVFISMRRGAAGGGIGLYLYNGSDYTLDNIKIDINVGVNGVGIQLGGGGGATAAFTGKVNNIKGKVGGGKGIFANYGTSLEISTSYIQEGYMHFYGMVYTTVTSCAVETSLADGYVVDQCSGLLFNACGTEANAKSGWLIKTGSLNTTLLNPFGAANNTSADTAIGELVQIDSSAGPYAVAGTVIINPVSLNPNAATTSDINGLVGTGETEIRSAISLSLTKGIAGDATWKATKLTVTGDIGAVSWTPTLVSWTNTGTPTVTGTYLKIGRLVYFTVVITPATNISCTVGTSSITGLPQTAVISGGGVQVDGNANSDGAVTVSSTGTIYPQTSGIITVPLTISGTLII